MLTRSAPGPSWRLAVALVAVAAVLAVLNSGGYRYAASDQAFYIPAVLEHLDPSLFPRDRAMLHVQDRFMLFDDLAAAAARVAHTSVPALFFGLFLIGLGLYFGAGLALGRIWYRSWWSVSALLLLMTLRHRISRTGVNTLEGYLHPRVLAFGLGLWAVVAFLRGRPAVAVVLVAGAAAIHTTTALWFAVWLGVAIGVADARWRPALAAGAAVAAVLGAWLLWAGPLAGHLVRIDEPWLAVLRIKDYLFPADWPVWAWALNLSYPVIVWIGYRTRAARGAAHPRERGLVLGAMALTAVFLASVPLTMVPVALAVQLQVSRVFWMLELMTALYLVWFAAEAGAAASARPRAVALVVALFAASRGLFVTWVERPERRVVQIEPADGAWTEAMAWIARTPVDTHVLADPDHAFRYGSSERALGRRDLFFEASKDTALAIYSREVAQRVRERIEALGDFGTLTPDRARALAARYDLDYLVTERPMDLPVRYANDRFTIYALKASEAADRPPTTDD